MKIYFIAPISQKPVSMPTYSQVVGVAQELGHRVQHEHITHPSKTMAYISGLTQTNWQAYYQQFLRWIAWCDVVLVEASFPSTINIGHEVTIALERGKIVVALYLQGKSGIFLHGLKSDRLFLCEYTPDTLREVTRLALKKAQKVLSFRFNFNLPPKINQYLEWMASKKRLPRSIYLRRLLERDRANNQEFQELFKGVYKEKFE